MQTVLLNRLPPFAVGGMISLPGVKRKAAQYPFAPLQVERSVVTGREFGLFGKENDYTFWKKFGNNRNVIYIITYLFNILFKNNTRRHSHGYQ